MHMAFFAAAAMAAVVAAAPAWAAIELQPGAWKTTETGTENGEPVPPEIETDCMSPGEARDAAGMVKVMQEQMAGQGAQCETFDVKQNGETVTFTMKCGVPQQFLMTMAGAYTFVSPTRYTGTMKSEIVIAGRKNTSDKTIEAVRVGACKPGEGNTK